MGMWGGILKGMNENVAEKFNQDKLDLMNRQEERLEETFELDKRTKQFDMMQSIRTRFGAGAVGLPTIGSKSTKKTAAANTFNSKEEYFEALKRLKVEDPALLDLYSSGGTQAAGLANLEKAFQLVKKAYDDQRSGDFIQGVPLNEAVGSMLSSAVISRSQNITLDDDWWDKTETDFQMVFSEEERNILGDNMVIPGSVTFLDPIQSIKPTKLEDITKVINMSEAYVKRELKIEKARLAAAQSKLIEQRKLPDGELSSEDMMVKAWLESRTQTIVDAESQATEFNDSAALNSLYGSTYIKEILKSQGSNFDTSLLPRGFGEGEQVPMLFNSKKEFALVYSKGIVPKGTLVTYIDDNGQRVTREVP
tara:strand:+ start:1183 stop:2277 length:1095 start_codon:yes stop_codon:yes gene_type:complete